VTGLPPPPRRAAGSRDRFGRKRLRKLSHPPSHLPLGWRVFFIASGWILVLIGVAGLALPGIQGVLTIIGGAALLSASSETSYWLLRRAFRRWPWGWRKLERARRRIYRRLVGTPRIHERRRDSAGEPTDGAGDGPRRRVTDVEPPPG
jgi:hypothetical protein